MSYKLSVMGRTKLWYRDRPVFIILKCTFMNHGALQKVPFHRLFQINQSDCTTSRKKEMTITIHFPFSDHLPQIIFIQSLTSPEWFTIFSRWVITLTFQKYLSQVKQYWEEKHEILKEILSCIQSAEISNISCQVILPEHTHTHAHNSLHTLFHWLMSTCSYKAKRVCDEEC